MTRSLTIIPFMYDVWMCVWLCEKASAHRTGGLMKMCVCLLLQDKMDGFVPAHFLGWYIKVGFGLKLPGAPSRTPSAWTLLPSGDRGSPELLPNLDQIIFSPCVMKAVEHVRKEYLCQSGSLPVRDSESVITDDTHVANKPVISRGFFKSFCRGSAAVDNVFIIIQIFLLCFELYTFIGHLLTSPQTQPQHIQQ